MFTISQAAERTGVSAHTLRYYEKIGLLPPPTRTEGGGRVYSEGDIAFLLFLTSLKKTGMSLQDMQEFVKDGCVWNLIESGADVQVPLSNRIAILNKHLESLEQQKQAIEAVMDVTREKIGIYRNLERQRQGESCGSGIALEERERGAR